MNLLWDAPPPRRQAVEDLVWHTFVKYSPDQAGQKDFDEAQHPRDDHGRFSDSGSDTDYLSTPSDAIEAIADGGHATVAPEDLRGVLERASKRSDHPDLTNLTVDGTAIFSGGLNIARADMPQIPGDHQQAFLDSLKAQNVGVKMRSMPPLKLTPTQNEIDATNVGQRLAKYEAGKKDLRAILVSKDDYVLDGHHRWATMAALHVESPQDKIRIPVIRIMTGHQHALDLMLAYGEAHGIAHREHGKALRPWHKYSPDQPRDDHGRFGEGSGSPAGHPSMASLVERLSQPDGGFTVQPVTGDEPTGPGHYAVSVLEGQEQVIDVAAMTPNDLAQFVATNSDRFTDPANYFGGWHDPESHTAFLDVSHVVTSLKDAEHLAVVHHQKAYFDFGTGKSVPREAHWKGLYEQSRSAFRSRSSGSSGTTDLLPQRLPHTDGQGADRRRDGAGAYDVGVATSRGRYIWDAVKFDESQHPRMPAGSPDGGQFGTSGDGSTEAKAALGGLPHASRVAARHEPVVTEALRTVWRAHAAQVSLSRLEAALSRPRGVQAALELLRLDDLASAERKALAPLLAKAAQDGVQVGVGALRAVGVKARAVKYSPDQPRVPAGESGGGQFGSSGTGTSEGESSDAGTATPVRHAALLESDLHARAGDFPIEFPDSTESSAESFSDLPQSVQDAAVQSWVSQQFDDDYGGDDAFEEANTDAIRELGHDNAEVVEMATSSLVETCNASAAFTDTQPNLFGGELHVSLDPKSVQVDDDAKRDEVPSLRIDDLRTVAGHELTAEQKAVAEAAWPKEYGTAFESKMDEIRDSDSFMESRNAFQNDAIAEAWNNLSDRDRMATVPDEARSYSDSSDDVMANASEALGVNAEGLSRAMVRVAQNFASEGEASVSFDGTRLEIKVEGRLDGCRYEIIRDFHEGADGLIAHHAYMVLPESAQRKGIATQMLVDSTQVYERYGVKAIEVLANIDRGGYSWGKLGFQASQPSLFMAQMNERMEAKQVAPERRTELNAIMSRAGADAPLAFAEQPEGKFVMPGSAWDGHISLSGATGRAFVERINDKAKKKKG